MHVKVILSMYDGMVQMVFENKCTMTFIVKVTRSNYNHRHMQIGDFDLH